MGGWVGGEDCYECVGRPAVDVGGEEGEGDDAGEEPDLDEEACEGALVESFGAVELDSGSDSAVDDDSDDRAGTELEFVSRFTIRNIEGA